MIQKTKLNKIQQIMNRINKRDTIEGMVFIIMTVSVLTLLCTLYEVKGLRELTKSSTDFRTIRK